MNTRFNPTANGDANKGVLHLGHVYMVLVNRHMAELTGGRFIVRFDDNQTGWLQQLGRERMADNCRKIIEELTWLGIRPYCYVWQSGRDDVIPARIHARFPDLVDVPAGCVTPILVRDDAPQYPDAQYLIAETVLHDQMDCVTQLIVGDELLGRFSAYRLWADLLGVPQIEAPIHLPRLRDGANEMGSVSKTVGNHRLQTYRDQGATPGDVFAMLREACLIEPKRGWDWRNVKREPVLEVVRELSIA